MTVGPLPHHLNKAKILNVLDKFLLFLGGGQQMWQCTANASFINLENEGGLFSALPSSPPKGSSITLQKMPPLLQYHQHPGAVFMNGRILVTQNKFEMFTPKQFSPWSPKEGQWSFIKFNWGDGRHGLNTFCIDRGLYAVGEC